MVDGSLSARPVTRATISGAMDVTTPAAAPAPAEWPMPPRARRNGWAFSGIRQSAT